MMRAQGRGAFLRAAGAGAICQLAHAPLFFWPAFVVGMTAFVWSLDGARLCPNKLRAFAWRGWSFGFGYFLAGLFWVGGAFLVEPEKFAIFLPFAISALPAGLGLFWAAAAAAAGSIWVNEFPPGAVDRGRPLRRGICARAYFRRLSLGPCRHNLGSGRRHFSSGRFCRHLRPDRHHLADRRRARRAGRR